MQDGPGTGRVTETLGVRTPTGSRLLDYRHVVPARSVKVVGAEDSSR